MQMGIVFGGVLPGSFEHSCAEAILMKQRSMRIAHAGFLLLGHYDDVMVLTESLISSHRLLLLILFTLVCNADERGPVLEVARGQQLVPSMPMLALLIPIAEAPARNAEIL